MRIGPKVLGNALREGGPALSEEFLQAWRGGSPVSHWRAYTR